MAATAALARAVAIPVIASGGIASIDDLRALKASGAPLDGAISGRALYEGRLDLARGGAAARRREEGGMALETGRFVRLGGAAVSGPTICWSSPTRSARLAGRGPVRPAWRSGT